MSDRNDNIILAAQDGTSFVLDRLTLVQYTLNNLFQVGVLNKNEDKHLVSLQFNTLMKLDDVELVENFLESNSMIIDLIFSPDDTELIEQAIKNNRLYSPEDYE